MKKILTLILIAVAILSLSACSSGTSKEPEKEAQFNKGPEKEVQLNKAPEKETKQVQVGDVITSQDWEIELTNAYSSTTLESGESSTVWTVNDGYAFAILEFDIVCLNSTRPTIAGSGITNLIATVNGNTYSSWEYKYIGSYGSWLSADNIYLDANLPLHIYVFTYVPEDFMHDKIDVELTIAGEECHMTIN